MLDEDAALTNEEIADRVYTGRMSVNAARSIVGLPPFKTPEADRLFVNTPTGPAFLD